VRSTVTGATRDRVYLHCDPAVHPHPAGRLRRL